MARLDVSELSRRWQRQVPGSRREFRDGSGGGFGWKGVVVALAAVCLFIGLLAFFQESLLVSKSDVPAGGTSWAEWQNALNSDATQRFDQASTLEAATGARQDVGNGARAAESAADLHSPAGSHAMLAQGKPAAATGTPKWAKETDTVVAPASHPCHEPVPATVAGVSDSQWMPGCGPSNVLDADPKTYAEAEIHAFETRRPQFTLDLGAALPIARYSVWILPREFGAHCCASSLVDGVVLGHTDLHAAESTWLTLARVEATPPEREWLRLSVSDSAGAAAVRYIRFVAAKETRVEIAELEVRRDRSAAKPKRMSTPWAVSTP
jgi:hypothetical protein